MKKQLAEIPHYSIDYDRMDKPLNFQLVLGHGYATGQKCLLGWKAENALFGENVFWWEVLFVRNSSLAENAPLVKIAPITKNASLAKMLFW